MTREEINKLHPFEPYCFETDNEEIWYQIGCIEGLNAADKEPNISALWHDASEEPLGEWNIVIFDTYGEFFSYTKEEANYMYEEEQGWKSFIKRVALIKWAYITDLLPKEDNK